MFQENIPNNTSNDEYVNKVTKQKNKEAWASLSRFARPLLIISLAGINISNLHRLSIRKKWPDLVEPILSFPLAGIVLASCVNVDVWDKKEVVRNYIYFLAKGLLVSLAIMLSNPSKLFFKKLNQGWLKDIFTGNMLHKTHGFGFRTMVIFHSLNLFWNDKLVKLVYGGHLIGF
jgi:uncharacterized membrane protein